MLPLLLASILLAAAPPAPAAPAVPAAPATPAEPLTLTATAFGEPVSIEVRDLTADAAEAAMRAALDEIEAIERLTARGEETSEPAVAAATTEAGASGGGPAGVAGGAATVKAAGSGGGDATPADLARLNAAAGAGAQAADPRLVELLARAEDFCVWSRGAYGPLGGRLRNGREGAATLHGDDLARAVASADCAKLKVDAKAGTVELAADSRLDLAGFAIGFAVDRAVALLHERNAGNGRVAVGPVQRAFGPGPGGNGWQASLPDPPRLVQPLTPVRLKDAALAVAAPGPNPGRPGESRGQYLDLRTGQPATGVVAAAAVTELAVDAQALSVTMFITGSHEGPLRLATLRPTPAVLWLLGSGSGPPILTDYHWSQVTLP